MIDGHEENNYQNPKLFYYKPTNISVPASLDADRTGRRRENIWMEEMKLGRLGFLV
jgi:hypothetical protein